MSQVIQVVPDDEQYKVMLAMWVEQHKPGYIDFGGVLWRVGQRHDDNATIFLRCGTNEDLYSDRSTKGLIK